MCLPHPRCGDQNRDLPPGGEEPPQRSTQVHQVVVGMREALDLTGLGDDDGGSVEGRRPGQRRERGGDDRTPPAMRGGGRLRRLLGGGDDGGSGNGDGDYTSVVWEGGWSPLPRWPLLPARSPFSGGWR
jgi:hypothetical protein